MTKPSPKKTEPSLQSQMFGSFKQMKLDQISSVKLPTNLFSSFKLVPESPKPKSTTVAKTSLIPKSTALTKTTTSPPKSTSSANNMTLKTVSVETKQPQVRLANEKSNSSKIQQEIANTGQLTSVPSEVSVSSGAPIPPNSILKSAGEAVLQVSVSEPSIKNQIDKSSASSTTSQLPVIKQVTLQKISYKNDFKIFFLNFL